MKNKLFTLSALVLTVLLITSCSTSRGYSSHKKGYGCPNSAGIKMGVQTGKLNA